MSRASADATGFFAQTTAATFTMPCAVQNQSRREELDLDRERDQSSKQLWYPNGYTVGHDDEITVSSVVYRVRGKPEDLGGRGRGWVVTIVPKVG